MRTLAQNSFRELLALLNRLDAAKIAYSLRHSRSDAITIEAIVPGERWEIEFVDYGEEVQIEVEVFRGSGVVGDEALVEELIAKHSD